jgi:16S rRNA (guanine966-N2)-methyltransferase
MRVIAGTARGRRLVAPPGLTTRPISDRAKEAIFNMLIGLGGVAGAEVIDLFAGSGSFGIECLSRGARHVTFVDQARSAATTIQANLDRLDFADKARIVTAPVERTLDSLDPADIAFCDPPYALDPWPDLLPRIRARLLVAHAEAPVPLTPEWTELRRRRYGRAHIVIASRHDRAAGVPGAGENPGE